MKHAKHHSTSYQFSSESVTIGHPDKLCDQISDAILDSHLSIDPDARVAIEVLATENLLVLAGEVTSTAHIDAESIARRVAREVGYDSPETGLCAGTCEIISRIQTQSPDIAQGVDTGGAGDQGLMFGFACDETDELMPLPIALAHALTRRAAEIRLADPSLGLLPDGKAQVTISYREGSPVRVDTVVLSHQHEAWAQGQIREILAECVVRPVLRGYSIDSDDSRLLLNPTGTFVRGGPAADTGLTGRKIIVDTYGGYAPHGGGAFSGKDPSKVDRSAAYMARFIAKNLVAGNRATKALVSLAYAIGVADPVMVGVNSYGTAENDTELERMIADRFDLTPTGIRKALGLGSPIYRETAKNGHFGNTTFPWEQASSQTVTN